MAVIPVVNVSCAVFDAAGIPVPGAIIAFRFSRVATVNGTIVPSYVTVITGNDGTATVQLCPNTLCGGSYGVRIAAAGIDSRGVAVIPNADCALDEVFQPVPYPDKTYIEAAIARINNANAAADEASAQASAALLSAAGASAAATNAATSAAQAAGSRDAAAGSATTATDKAAAAATSATAAAGHASDAQTAQATAEAARDTAVASVEAATVVAAYYIQPVDAFYDPTVGIPGIPNVIPARRYIASATANGWTKGYIYTGKATWEPTAPVKNMSLTVSGVRYSYSGTDWLPEIDYAMAPAHYARDVLWAVKGSTIPTDRYTLLTPSELSVRIGSGGYRLAAPLEISLASYPSWDDGTYVTAANRAGKDFYFYAVPGISGAPKFILSANSTFPDGYTAETSRKIGGFHCLCAAGSGTMYDPTFPLADFMAGDILPASVWDLKHRPVSSPEGMVYVAGIGKWADIYLSSVSGSALVSVNGGTIADGMSTPAFHWPKFCQWFGKIGKRLPTQQEFVAISLGSNQGTNISGTADPGTTGGHSDTGGRRMLSNVGCEDCCGAMWQWSGEAGGPYAAALWVAAYDANDSGVGGSSYNTPNRALVGGSWASGAACGSRGSIWAYGPLALNAYYGARGVAEPLAVAL